MSTYPGTQDFFVPLKPCTTDASPSQIEIFGGIACSCMPSVYKFFSETDLPFKSLQSTLIRNVSRYFNKTAEQEKLPDHTNSPHRAASWEHTTPSAEHRSREMRAGIERSRADDSRSHLTHKVSVFCERNDKGETQRTVDCP